MAWLFPSFLAGLCALAIPLALHFLRRQPRRTIAFPSLRFLAVANQRSEKRHRLMRLLVLTLRCLALALLAAGFAQPFFGEEGKFQGKSIVVVIDNSFSLQAKDRWSSLRAWARQQVGSCVPGDKVGLLLTGPSPTWLTPLTTDTASVLRQLETLEPGWQSTRNEPALRLAADTLEATAAQERRIIFLGDHQRVSWTGTDFSKPLPPGLAVSFPPVAEPLAHQATLSAPTLTQADHGLHGSVTIRNFTAAQTRTLRVYREDQDKPLQEVSVALGDRETRTVSFALPDSALVSTADALGLRFTLDPDDLPADDTLYVTWTPSQGRAVLLDAAPLGSGADYLSTALNSTAAMTPPLTVTSTVSAPWPAGAVAVLRNEASFFGAAGVRLEAFLQAGGSAFIFVDGSTAQKQWLAEKRRIEIRSVGAKGKPSISVHDWAMDHPVVAAMSEHEVSPLLGWNFSRGWALPADVVEPLALWSTGSAAVGEVQVGAGRLLLCGFQPDRREGDWPVHVAFVPFLHRAISYLLGAEANRPPPTIKVGEFLALPAESGTWRALAGPAAPEPARTVGKSVRPTRPGLYEFVGGGTQKQFAVNLASEESDPALWTDGTPWLGLVSTQSLSSGRRDPPHANLASFEAEQHAPLWWWLFATAVFLLLVELGLANRTAR